MELEEFTPPTYLNINHSQACFTASDPNHDWNQVFEFTGIILAGIKQRLMWPPYQTATESKRAPLCKSNDNKNGFPTANFPWSDERSISLSGLVPVETKYNPLNCDDCKFKLDPQKHKRDGLPVCESLYKLVLLDENEKIVILTTSGAAKRVMAHYAQWFKAQKAPTFTYETLFQLHSVKNNGRRWADLEVTKGEKTDRNRWVNDYLPLWRHWKNELEAAPTVINDTLQSSATGTLEMLEMK